MYRWDPHALLRHYLEQQYSVTAIAAAFGSDRRTAQRWIATGDPDRDPRAPLRAPAAGPPQLDPCKPLIGQRPDTYPLLTAVRLFEEVLAAEYAGSLTQLKGYTHQVRPRPEREPVIRFETAPGNQAQVDFADVRLPWGRRFALMVALGCSRPLWAQFLPRQPIQTLMRGPEEAFHSCRRRAYRRSGLVFHRPYIDRRNRLRHEANKRGRSRNRQTGAWSRRGQRPAVRKILRPINVDEPTGVPRLPREYNVHVISLTRDCEGPVGGRRIQSREQSASTFPLHDLGKVDGLDPRHVSRDATLA
jgi:hypothetical protein